MDEVFVIGTEPVEVAQPAAVANPDLLLDLYDDEAEDLGPPADSATDLAPSVDEEGGDLPPGRVDEVPVQKKRRKAAVEGLPSLDDEL